MKRVFIFQAVWPVLRILQLFGHFPCRKVTDLETNQVTLEPLNTSRIFWSNVAIFGAYFLAVIIVSINGLYKSFSHMSLIDITCAQSCFAAVYGVLIYLVSNLLYLKDYLMELQTHVNHHFPIDTPKTTKVKCTYIFTTSLMLLGSICSLLIFATALYDNNPKDLFTISVNISVSIFNWILMLTLLGVGVAFMMIFGEISQLLILWIDYLVHNCVVNQCLDAIKATEIADKAFSKQFFAIFSLALLGQLGFVYSLITSFFLSMNNLTLPLIFYALANVCFSLVLKKIVIFSNHQSQKIIDNYKLLEEAILSDTFPGEKSKKELVLFKLRGFKGFTANGYFNLGKPLMSSITGNMLTYLVILVQFKLSEKQIFKE